MTDLSVIRKRADFLSANRGLRVARPGFVLLANPNGGLGKRFGVTVTKKIGNAVVRNRMKRRFRELLRAALPELGLPDHDHVLIGREGGVERDFAQLRDELTVALGRAAEGKGDPIDHYVIAMCARQLVQGLRRDHGAFWQGHASDAKRLNEQLGALAPLRERLVARHPTEMPRFLDWFDEWFLRRATPVVTEAP